MELSTSNKNNKKMIVINGGHFSNLAGFYEEVSGVLMKDVDWKVGTLDGFDDILYGGFGVFENNEEIEIIWKDAKKSEDELGLEATREFYERKIKQGRPFNTELIQEKLDALISGEGQTLFDILIEIIESHEKIKLTLD
ncbi:ribonuclease inhibitor [Chryseobacterium sp. T16E-39]|uniref:ribonuclease inhibitor n=1 Tax=Chryseobacterium sp. T16E-39 TaxID=2015076 RepID=UPI000B5B3EDD|nr:ribonuclease inhibitor [Chryseobacterium sp. T16E-39]ASK29852.1 ribonuclease inhibitor [Chryseobacterium sp. T16E-39]